MPAADLGSRSRWRGVLLPVMVAVLIGAVVEVVELVVEQVQGSHLSPVQYPRPHAIVSAFFQHFGSIAAAAPQTLETALIGFFGGLLIGAVVACVLWLAPPLRIAVSPYLILIPMLPIVAIAPLLTVMIHDAFVGRVILAIYVTCFPVIINTAKGLQSLERGKADVLATYGASRLQQLRKANWPAAVPFFFAGARIGATWCIIGGIILEFTGTAGSGLGVLMLKLSYFSSSEDSAYFLWGTALGSAVLGLLLSAAVIACEALVLRGRRPR
jgi:NitT/TauT family transport system permease protein